MKYPEQYPDGFMKAAQKAKDMEEQVNTAKNQTPALPASAVVLTIYRNVKKPVRRRVFNVLPQERLIFYASPHLLFRMTFVIILP